MKLKYKFEIVEVGDDITAVPVGDGADAMHGVLQLNDAGADIMRLLENDTTEPAIVGAIYEMYDVEKQELTGQVHDFIETLKKDGIITE